MKKRPKTGVKVEKIVYFICSTLNTVLLGQASPIPYQNHLLDPVSLSMDDGWIRIFKTRIRIGDKTRILPDPNPNHWILSSQLPPSPF